MKPWSPLVLVSPFFVASLMSVATGCGSTVDTSTFDDPTDGSATDGSATDGTASDTGASTNETGASDTATGAETTPNPGTDGGTPPGKDTGPPAKDAGTPTEAVTLDNVCTKLADVVCSNAQRTCCTSQGVDYKPEGCRAGVAAWCDGEVTQVKGGTGTFNAAAYATCASAWSTLQAKCTIPLLDYVETYAPCHQLFPGTVAPGGVCREDTDCKVAPGALGSCTQTQNGERCSETSIAQDGQPCDYEGATKILCDYGLSCQFSSTSGAGTCRPAKKTGESCNFLECGFGNYCNRPSGGGSGTCAVGLAAGASCSTDGVCASGDCSSGTCTDPNVTVAHPFFCSGTP